MIGETHRMGGIALGTVGAIAMLSLKQDTNLLACGVVIAGSAIGSLIPDIDHKGSMIGKKFPLLSSIVSSTLDHRGAVHSLLGLFVFSLVTVTLGYFLENYSADLSILLAWLSILISVGAVNFGTKLVTRLAHRKVSKKRLRQMDIVVAVICAVLSLKAPVVVGSFVPYYVVGLSVGYLSHLLLDALNPTGVPFAYPSDKRISVANITTGSTLENFVLLVCTVGAIIGIIATITMVLM